VKDKLQLVLNFLKQYYDKIVLGLMLIVLAWAMWTQLGQLEKTREKIVQGAADIRKGLPKDPIPPLAGGSFDSSIEVDASRIWLDAYGEGSLVDPAIFVYSIDGSPHLLHLTTKTNPFTGKPDFPEGVTDIDVEVVGQRDSDRDGIPDAAERKHGLNEKNPADAATDLDGDFFSNLDEYKAETDLNDSGSHPPLIERIFFGPPKRTPLNIILKNITYDDPNDPDGWDIALRVYLRNRPRDLLGLKIDSAIEGTPYRIIDAQLKKRKNPRTNAVETIPVIIVQAGDDGERVLLPKGRKVLTGDATFPLYDLSPGKLRQLRAKVGDSFTLVDAKQNRFTYVLGQDDSKKPPHATEVKTNTRYEIQRMNNAVRDRFVKMWNEMKQGAAGAAPDQRQPGGASRGMPGDDMMPGGGMPGAGMPGAGMPGGGRGRP
jgi:hypothetical protein